MARKDFAILVGISHYPNPGFPPLQGPPRDVERFRQWLVDPEGGDVDPANISVIVSPEPLPPVAPEQAPPQFTDFQVAFQHLITNGGGALQFHGDSRLYLYFSGHGFCEIRNQMPQAAIYAANASRLFNWNIAGTLYALWAKEAAVFGEIVLVMDCCRDAEATKLMLNPPLPVIVNPGAARNVKLFCVYAAPKGGKAQERPIAELGNAVHSLLTHVLLDALRHAPPDSEGNITGQMLKNYIENAWPAACGAIPADPPEIYIPPTGDIVFFRRPPQHLNQILRLSSWAPGAILEILDGRNQLCARLSLPPPGGTEVEVRWADQRQETLALADGALSLPLPAGLYQARLLSGGEERRQLFQAGGEDVRL
ncbi:caspase family protein [Geoalkalibacter sp.]|uniref:caspase family protein n=1 Tax=Geoalkalibacter sp. TaxID=3041440 RepID=UPI00272E0873|nr:caspase family protein [Geoalkalibacter sp.]